MSDEELLNRQGELSRRYGWAARFSGTGEMASQLWAMIQAIDAERRDRILRQMFDDRNKMFPEIIETEPDMVEAKKKKEEEEDNKMIARRKAGRERFTLSKTSNPRKDALKETLLQRSDKPEIDGVSENQENNSEGDQ